MLPLILLLAAALRLMDVQMPLIDGFSWREASTAMMADNFRLNSWNIFYPEVSWTGPGPGYQGREFQLLSYITALLHLVFGWHDWFGRAVATGFGLLTVFALHRLVAEVWDTRHAHAAALAYAVLPAAVAIDSSFLPDPAMLGLVTLGMWLFLRYWRGDPTPYLLILATASFTLGVLCKLPGLAAGLVVAWLFGVGLLRGRAGGHGGQALPILLHMTAGLAVIFAYYAWALYLGRTYPPFHTAGSGYVWDVGLSDFLGSGYFLAELWTTARWWFYGVPLIALGAVGVWMGAPRDRGDATLAAVPYLWLAAGVILYLAAARQIVNNPWNLHILSVPIAIFIGRGAIWLVDIGTSAVARGVRTVALLTVVVVFVTLPLYGNIKEGKAYDGMVLGEAVAAVAGPAELVVLVAPTVGDPVAIYYSHRRGWVFPPGGGDRAWSIFSKTDAEAIAELEALRAEGARWFGVTLNARDAYGRLFVDHHAGVLAHLDITAQKVAETAQFVLYRLPD